MNPKTNLFVIQNLNLSIFLQNQDSFDSLLFLTRDNEKEFFNLHSLIESFWSQNLAKFDGLEAIYWVIGPKASYTDTRILNTWLKTFLLFKPQIKLVYLSLDLEVTREDAKDLEYISQQILEVKSDSNFIQPDVFWSRNKEYIKISVLG
jgi:hypothetical protein